MGGRGEFGTLVIRVWVEPDHLAPLRVRITGDAPTSRPAVFTTPEQAIDHVAAWLAAYAAGRAADLASRAAPPAAGDPPNTHG